MQKLLAGGRGSFFAKIGMLVGHGNSDSKI